MTIGEVFFGLVFQCTALYSIDRLQQKWAIFVDFWRLFFSAIHIILLLCSAFTKVEITQCCGLVKYAVKMPSEVHGTCNDKKAILIIIRRSVNKL